MTDTALTPAQNRAVHLIVADMRASGRDEVTYSIAPRRLAELLWPDSPAWQRRTRFGAVSNQGALGGTMPMNAAKLLWRLHDHGMVRRDDYRWYLISKAVRHVEGETR